jgi:hypothetical protein
MTGTLGSAIASEIAVGASGATASVITAVVDGVTTAAERLIDGPCTTALAGEVPLTDATSATVRIDVRSRIERFIFITY